MGSGDHHPRVRAVFLHQIGHRRGGHHPQKDGVRPHRAQTGDNRGLQHVRGHAGILADHYPGTAVFHLDKHHRRGAADRHRQLTRQFRIGDAPRAVGAKQSSHENPSPFLRRRHFRKTGKPRRRRRTRPALSFPQPVFHPTNPTAAVGAVGSGRVFLRIPAGYISAEKPTFPALTTVFPL